ncbi:MAG: GNAT family N-acetyltransferase [bacterium]|nr:GNAT family N-acetyltransferase [bacterium]
MDLEIVLRPIELADNSLLAKIIRAGIVTLGLPTEGTAHSDSTTDDLFALFKKPGAYYFVVELQGEVLGGCGVYPSNGLPEGYAELVRFFLDPKVRGKGVGKLLMQQCEQKALELGYRYLYLESFPEMETAVYLYQLYGFKTLAAPLGNTGHFACNVWMEKQIYEVV